MTESKIAAIDLGSNSFHLLIVQALGDEVVILERLKEKVQLLEGYSGQTLSSQARQRGLDCLDRFGQRLREVHPSRVVVMGTHALRVASDTAEFCQLAQSRLKVPVEVVSGEREAELIFLGVARHVQQPGERRLVIDIGGGSTELAGGSGFHPDQAVSLPVGCVSFRDRFFAKGFSPEAFLQAKAAAVDALQGAKSKLTLEQGGVQRVFGTSGTIESIRTVMAANGWISEDITQDAMSRLQTALLQNRWVVQAGLPGLAPDRVDIFPGGAAILAACFDVLNIASLTSVDASLLQGMVWNFQMSKGEISAAALSELDDLRDASIAQLAVRHGVNDEQARRVSGTAELMMSQVKRDWSDIAEFEHLLRWACQIHEVGAQINSEHYHRHGGYILKHAQIPGLTDAQREILALLVKGHRRSLPGLAFRAFDPQLSRTLLRILVVLRLSVILHRSHDNSDLPDVVLETHDDVLKLKCSTGWLSRNRLSARELEIEVTQLATAGLSLEVS